MLLRNQPGLIDLYPNGEIIIRNPSEKEPCFKEFRNMMFCINDAANNKKSAHKCTNLIKAWDTCSANLKTKY